jgi:hypothetical protein
MSIAARNLSQAIRKYWFKLIGRKHHTEVFLHDPGAERPHDLDYPFYDPKVQARVGDTISKARQEK